MQTSPNIMPPDPHDEQTWRLAIWLNGNWSWIVAGALCICVALLRAYLDNVKITGRDVAEAIICGIIVTVSKPIMLSVGITDSFAPFTGAVVGLLGARVMRPLLETLARGILAREGKDK